MFHQIDILKRRFIHFLAPQKRTNDYDVQQLHTIAHVSFASAWFFDEFSYGEAI